MPAKPRLQQCYHAKPSQQIRNPSVALLASLVLLIAWVVNILPTVGASPVDADDSQFYLYLKEDPESVRPIDEYKSSDPTTDVDKRRPGFVYDPTYTNHRIVECT